jgi:UDP-N-acetylmuramoyl-tripeptide--D-alanyl-D-alanine ligase
MRELGAQSMAAHERIGRLAAELGIDRIVCVGPAAAPIVQGAAGEPNWRGSAQSVPDAETAITLLVAERGPSDAVLVKASRSIGLEKVAEALLQGDAA